MFQFLIGWLQTQSIVQYTIKSFCVSIPYRLATNLYLIIINFLHIWKFQFLIGWLQTCRKYRCVTSSWKFQFLIGWLQTKKFLQFLQFLNFQFQFLIGWLQTHSLQIKKSYSVKSFNSLQVGYKRTTNMIKRFALLLVSIPYRLATN